MTEPKILTQCYTSDLRHIVEFSLSLEEDQPIPKLPKKEQMALLAVACLLHAGLEFEEIYTIKEIVFWNDYQWVYKFHQRPEALKVKEKLDRPEARKLVQEKLDLIGKKVEDAKSQV